MTKRKVKAETKPEEEVARIAAGRIEFRKQDEQPLIDVVYIDPDGEESKLAAVVSAIFEFPEAQEAFEASMVALMTGVMKAQGGDEVVTERFLLSDQDDKP